MNSSFLKKKLKNPMDTKNAAPFGLAGLNVLLIKRFGI